MWKWQLRSCRVQVVRTWGVGWISSCEPRPIYLPSWNFKRGHLSERGSLIVVTLTTEVERFIWNHRDTDAQTCCRPTEQFIRLICQLLRFNFFEVYRNPNLRPKESSEYHYHDVTQRHVLMKSGCYDPDQHYGRGTNGAGIEPRERTPARWQM